MFIIGSFISLSSAILMALSYPASACLITPVPGSLVNTLEAPAALQVKFGREGGFWWGGGMAGGLFGLWYLILTSLFN